MFLIKYSAMEGGDKLVGWIKRSVPVREWQVPGNVAAVEYSSGQSLIMFPFLIIEIASGGRQNHHVAK